jgi:hypothetical protein
LTEIPAEDFIKSAKKLRCKKETRQKMADFKAETQGKALLQASLYTNFLLMYLKSLRKIILRLQPYQCF